jgi:hypothetical protein
MRAKPIPLPPPEYADEDEGEGEDEGTLVVVVVPLTHVYPTFGREHEMTPECWCHPEPDDEQPNLLIHNVDN